MWGCPVWTAARLVPLGSQLCALPAVPSSLETDRYLMYSTNQHLIFQGKPSVWGGYVWIW